LLIEGVAVGARDQVEDGQRITQRILARSRAVLRCALQQQLFLPDVEATRFDRAVYPSFDTIQKTDQSEGLLHLRRHFAPSALAGARSPFPCPALLSPGHCRDRDPGE
jgi:hypothetical protein